MSDDLTIDWSQTEATFGQALKKMAELTDLPLKQVVRAEAGSILKTCVAYTGVADAEKVPGRARKKLIAELELNTGDVVISSGVRSSAVAGQIVAISTGPRSHRKRRVAYGPGDPVGAPANIHWRRSDWTDIQEAKFDYVRRVVQAVRSAIKAIGLSRQSWIQIADSLHIRLEDVPGGKPSAAAIGKARAAMASDGKAHTNGRSREAEMTDQYFVDLINGYPAQEKVGMPRVLLTAIRNRQKHFEMTLNKGVFDSFQSVAQQFPGFYVNQGLN